MAAPTSAFFRWAMGVGPACAVSPRTSTITPRTSKPPVTTPTGMPFSSRIGPCSMWSSKYASTGRPADGRGTRVADARQLLTDGAPVAIGPRQGPRQGPHAGKDGGGEHRRREPGPLFVRPAHQLDATPCAHTGVVQG